MILFRLLLPVFGDIYFLERDCLREAAAVRAFYPAILLHGFLYPFLSENEVEGFEGLPETNICLNFDAIYPMRVGAVRIGGIQIHPKRRYFGNSALAETSYIYIYF